MSVIICGKSYPCLFWFMEEGIYPLEHRGGFETKQQNPLDEQRNPGRYILEDPLKVPVLMEYARRLLYDPILWMQHPGIIPDELKDFFHPTPSFFKCCMEAWEEIDETLKVCVMDEKDCEEELQAMQRLPYALLPWITETAKASKATTRYDSKLNHELIHAMIDEFHRALSVCFAINSEQADFYELIKQHVYTTQQQLQSIQGKPRDKHIEALIEGIDNQPLIVRIPGTNYYKRNMAFCKEYNKGHWYESALICFKRKGLKEPNWTSLARDYIRKENGTEYKNITRDIKRW